MNLRSDQGSSRPLVVRRRPSGVSDGRGATRWLAGGSLLLAVLAGCGGGGGAAPDPHLVQIDAVSTGVVPVNAASLYGGAARIELRRAGSTSAVDARDVIFSGTQDISFTKPSEAPAGTELTVAVVRHPLNQLCTATPSAAIRAGGSRVQVTLSCVSTWLNDTGSLTCGSPDSCAAQDVSMGRDAERSRLTRVSGSSIAGGFDYTRICNNGELAGKSLDCIGNPVKGVGPTQWGCTRDNVTGLIWRILDEPIAPVSYDQRPNAPGLTCGIGGWRLPTAHELASLINSGGTAAGATAQVAAMTSYLPMLDWVARNSGGQGPEAFWTSTQVPGSLNRQFVSFSGTGAVGLGSDNQLLRVVWVSDGRIADRRDLAPWPSPRYTTEVSGQVVRDQHTSLSWSVCSLGRQLSGATCVATSGAQQTFTWDDAVKEVALRNQAKWAGYSDWRLPNRAELASLIDYGSTDGVLIASAVPSALRSDARTSTGANGGDSYWSSTWVPQPNSDKQDACEPDPLPSAYQVHFGEGTVAPAFVGQTCQTVSGSVVLDPASALRLRVRLVRDTR